MLPGSTSAGTMEAGSLEVVGESGSEGARNTHPACFSSDLLAPPTGRTQSEASRKGSEGKYRELRSTSQGLAE